MSAAEFVARAFAALALSGGHGSESSQALDERQRDRATRAALRFQLGQLDRTLALLSELANEASSDAERKSWQALAAEAVRRRADRRSG